MDRIIILFCGCCKVGKPENEGWWIATSLEASDIWLANPDGAYLVWLCQECITKNHKSIYVISPVSINGLVLNKDRTTFMKYQILHDMESEE